MAAYGNSFGEAWRNAFLEDQARNASVAQSTDRLLAVLGNLQQRKMQERVMAQRAQAEAVDMQMRQQIFSNQMGQQALANKWRGKEFAAERAAEDRAAAAANNANAIREMEFQWRVNQPSAAEIRDTQRKTELSDAENALRAQAVDLAGHYNRLDAVKKTIPFVPTAKDVKDESWMPFSVGSGEDPVRARLAELIPPNMSVDVAKEPIEKLSMLATTYLTDERSTLERMIANLEHRGVDEFVTQTPTGEWAVRGAPGTPSFVGPVSPAGQVAPALPAAAVPAKVRVIAPDGRTGSIPGSQLQEALRNGYRVIQ